MRDLHHAHPTNMEYFHKTVACSRYDDGLRGGVNRSGSDGRSEVVVPDPGRELLFASFSVRFEIFLRICLRR